MRRFAQKIKQNKRIIVSFGLFCAFFFAMGIFAAGISSFFTVRSSTETHVLPPAILPNIQHLGVPQKTPAATASNSNESIKPFSCTSAKQIFLPVLMYHHIRPITPDMNKIDAGLSMDPIHFESQVKRLSKEGYTFYFMTDLIKMIRDGTEPEKKSVILTFDDGYKDALTFALPIILKYDAKATLFIIGDYLGSTSGTNSYLNPDELKQMAATGHIQLESHTYSHPDLTKVPDNRLTQEIPYAKTYLENIFGMDFSIFSYPSGKFDDKVLTYTKNAKYAAAVTTRAGGYHSCATLFEIRRIRPDKYTYEDIVEKLNQFQFTPTH